MVETHQRKTKAGVDWWRILGRLSLAPRETFGQTYLPYDFQGRKHWFLELWRRQELRRERATCQYTVSPNILLKENSGPTPKLPHNHLMTPSSIQPNHHFDSRVRCSCSITPAYSRSTSSFSVRSPPMKATSSENSANREWVWRRDPANWAESAANIPKGGVR